jgi:hypothetical protein
MLRSGLTLTLAFGALTWGACSAAPPSTPLRYPELPAARAAHAGQLLPDPGLTAVALACDAAESSSPNGVDDDCDGVIDGAPPAASDFTIVVAHTTDPALELRIALTDARGAAAPEASLTRGVQRGASATLSRLEITALPPGRYQVSVAQAPGATPAPTGPSAGGDKPRELALGVALADRQTSHNYLASLAFPAREPGADGARTLAVIEVR